MQLPVAVSLCCYGVVVLYSKGVAKRCKANQRKENLLCRLDKDEMTFVKVYFAKEQQPSGTGVESCEVESIGSRSERRAQARRLLRVRGTNQDFLHKR